MSGARRATRLVAALGAALACAACTTPDTPDTRVHGRSTPAFALVVVDGLDARDVADDMPELARAWRESRWCPGAHARASMPARTNVNHATLVTGVHPEMHGITGNVFWARGADPPRKLGAAADFLTETVFTLAATHQPPLTTAVAVGKPKLETMFAATLGGRQIPDAVWSPKNAAADGRDAATGFALDAATLDGARRLLDDTPSFLLVNLSDVDRVSHAAGPHSDAARATRHATDAALAAFVRDVLGRADWRNGTMVVTSDHGFDTTTHPAIDVAALLADAAADASLAAGGVADALVAVPDGRVAHVYGRDNPRAVATVLAAARRRAVAQEGIAEALYRMPNREDEWYQHMIDHVHPDWHLSNLRTGDLLLIAAPGYAFAASGGDEADLRGNHGGPGETDVPVLALGGGTVAGDRCDDLRAVDIGRTLLGCLGLRDVARLDGGPIEPEERGRILHGVCASPAAAPSGNATP